MTATTGSSTKSSTSSKSSKSTLSPRTTEPTNPEDTERHGVFAHVGRLESPLTTYYLILGSAAALVVFGLIMVYSASSVEEMLAGSASYTAFAKQAGYAVVGGLAAWAASRLSIRAWRLLAVPSWLLGLALLALVFVPGVGYEVLGNRNWIKIGPFSGQPSEFAKLSLVLVGALVFTNKGRLVLYLRHVILPYLVPVAVCVLALVLAGKDLGTAMVMMIIIASVLAVAGTPARYFAMAGALLGLGVTYLVLTSSNRMTRITNFFSADCQSNPDGPCGQSVHGLFALADGGWWGVGLGASKEKWAWLAEAQNDFIFAIIGEELGLPGTLMVLALFGAFAWGCYRLVSRSRDPFVRIASMGIMAWIAVQAIVNIGSVIGLIPVIGVPLPFISAGGSSLIATLVAVGMLLSFARSEPGASALLSGRSTGMIARSRAVFASRAAARASRRSR